MQVGEGKVALMNMKFKGKCHACGKYGHKQNKCTEKNKSEEEKGNKKFSGECNQCSKMGNKDANCLEHEANMANRPKNWKKKEDKKVGGSNIGILLGCTKTSAIEYEADEVLFKIDLWELVLKKLDKIPVPSNPPDDNENNMGNVNIEKPKKMVSMVKKVQVGPNTV